MSKVNSVNSPRMPYIGMPGGTLLANTLAGKNISTALDVRISDEAITLAHDHGDDAGDEWKGQSDIFGDISFRADASGFTATVAMFPDVTIRLTESNACEKKRCPFPLLGALLIDGVPEVLSVRQVLAGQVVSCEGATCKPCASGTCKR